MSDDTEAVEFGDFDPEDEYDEGDPFSVRLEILERIVESIQGARDERFKVRLEAALQVIGKMVREHQDDTVRLERIKAALEALN